MAQLYEQYRPKDWSEVTGQPRVVSKLMVLKRRGLAGRAYWICGKSGTGKTTIGRLIAAEIADELSVHELDATGYMPSGVEVDARQMRCRSLTPPHGQAVIINEAHGLRNDTIRKLLVTLEDIPEHATWIFTTTNEAQQGLFDTKIDASPLLSRCVELALQSNCRSEFAARAKMIAEDEGLGGATMADYEQLVQNKDMNMRAVLQAVESGEMVRDVYSLIG